MENKEFYNLYNSDKNKGILEAIDMCRDSIIGMILSYYGGIDKMDFDDILQECAMEIIRILPNYTPLKNANFKTFASPYLKNKVTSWVNINKSYTSSYMKRKYGKPEIVYFYNDSGEEIEYLDSSLTYNLDFNEGFYKAELIELLQDLLKKSKLTENQIYTIIKNFGLLGNNNIRLVEISKILEKTEKATYGIKKSGLQKMKKTLEKNPHLYEQIIELLNYC